MPVGVLFGCNSNTKGECQCWMCRAVSCNLSLPTFKTNQHKLLVCSAFLKSAEGSGSRKNAKFSSMELSTARCVPLYEVLESGFVLFEVSAQVTHSGMLQDLTGTGCSREHRDA